MAPTSNLPTVLVFAKRKKGNQHVLVVARHNLGDGTWKSDDEPDELELPDGVTEFWALVNQIRTVDVPPSVIITEGVMARSTMRDGSTRAATSGKIWRVSGQLMTSQISLENTAR